MSQVKEYFLSVNKFDEPTEVIDAQAIQTLIIRLLIMNPGESDINPEAGVGLYTKWRYCDSEKLPELESTIQDQLNTYIPILLGCEVNVELDEEEVHMYVITIKIAKSMYVFAADTTSQNISAIKN